MSEIIVTREEAAILAQALNEICGGPESIDEVEFHSRIGIEKVEAVKLLDDILLRIRNTKAN
jgi:hypothetical protein